MTAPSAGRRVVLYSRVDCHLCDEARLVVAAVTADLGVAWAEVDVDADPEDRAEYGDMVPVVLVDGEMFGYFSVDGHRLRTALSR